MILEVVSNLNNSMILNNPLKKKKSSFECTISLMLPYEVRPTVSELHLFHWTASISYRHAVVVLPPDSVHMLMLALDSTSPLLMAVQNLAQNI